MLRAVLLAAPLALTPLAPTALAQSREAQVILPESQLATEHPALYDLFEGMGLYEVLHVMSLEGIEAADQMEADMFPGQGGAAWPAVVAGVYSTDRLIADFEASLPTEVFTDEVVAELLEFVTSDVGQRVAEGEVAARVAFLEPGVEESATQIANQMREDKDPRIDLLSEFIALNALIERNVSGALNANFAFFQGLTDGDAFEVEMPEDLMLAEVWGQEPEIRSSTTEWLYAYQVTAYSGLSDAELQQYVDLSATEAGRVLNTALFTAFDVMFERVSYDLGAAAAVFIAGEET